MMPDKGRISRKELFSGSMVIFIALFYAYATALQISQEKFLQLHWMQVKLLLLSAVYILAGMGFLMRKKSGWIMCCAILFCFITIVLSFFIRISQTQPLDAFAFATLGVLMLLFMAFISLFAKDTRGKYQVNNKAYLLAMLIYLALIGLIFLL